MSERQIVSDGAVTVLLGTAVVVLTLPSSRANIWSPYYRISVEPLTRIADRATQRWVDLAEPIGQVLTVNNDYHQMMLDLGPGRRSPPS